MFDLAAQSFSISLCFDNLVIPVVSFIFGPLLLLLPRKYLYTKKFFLGNAFIIKQKGSCGIYNLWLTVSRMHHLISVELL